MTLFDVIFVFFNDTIFTSNNGGINNYLANPTFNIGGVNFIMQHYLSFICTIISMVVLVLLCCAFIKKVYNLCAHIIG